jgi:hypothetical protein
VALFGHSQAEGAAGRRLPVPGAAPNHRRSNTSSTRRSACASNSLSTQMRYRPATCISICSATMDGCSAPLLCSGVINTESAEKPRDRPADADRRHRVCAKTRTTRPRLLNIRQGDLPNHLRPTDPRAVRCKATHQQMTAPGRIHGCGTAIEIGLPSFPLPVNSLSCQKTRTATARLDGGNFPSALEVTTTFPFASLA